MILCVLVVSSLFIVYCEGFIFYETELRDCPNVPEQETIDIEKVLGSWRLAYFFLDQPGEDYDEEATCALTEIKDYNNTHLTMHWFLENIHEDQIDRSSFVLPATLLTKGEWVLHTPFGSHDFLHVTVLSASDQHLVLTFCGNPLGNSNNGIGYVERSHSQPADQDDVIKEDTYLDAIIKRDSDSLHKNRKSKNDFEDDYLENLIPDKDFSHSDFKQNRFNEPNLENYEHGFRFKRQTHDRRKLLRRPNRRRFFKGRNDRLRFRRYAGKRETSNFDRILKNLEETDINEYLERNKEQYAEKHLWTIILLRNNIVSALNYVQYATFLMKLGFDLTQGELVSFGKCQIIH